ncbi:MAG: ABC transporter permease [Actinomycetales bacterium]|nr:ABC transporter permease [Actinomycetales bacterium]
MSNQVTSLASGHEGSLADQVRAYLLRLKGGEMGSVPAVAATLVLAGVFAALSPFFLTKLNFTNMFVQAAELTMLSAALVFVILLAEIDLSAGVTAGVAMAVFIVLIKFAAWNWIAALGVAFVVGIVVGWVIGFVVAKIGVPSFVVTLAFLLGFQGMQLVLLGEGGVYRVETPEVLAIMNENLPSWGGWAMVAIGAAGTLAFGLFDRARRAKTGLVNRPVSILAIKVAAIVILGGISVAVMNENRSQGIVKIAGVPIVVPITLVILVAMTLLLDRTKFGRHLYAVGGNPEAARRAGIKVARIRIYAFIICAMLAVVSGVFHASRIGSVDGSSGRTIVLNGVAAAVVGGVSLFGGRGRLSHAAIGAVVITMIDNGLGLLQMPAGANFLITGGVLLLAATIDALARRRSGGSIARN